MPWFSLATMLLCVCTAEPDAKLAKLVILCEQATANARKDLQAEYDTQLRLAASGKRGRIDSSLKVMNVIDQGDYVFPSVRMKKEFTGTCQRAATQLRQKMDAMSAVDAFVTPLLPPKLSVGYIGRMPGPVRVVQVIDESNMIVTGDVGTEREKPAGSPEQRWRTGSATVWLEGMDTDGVVPQKEISTEKVFEIIDSKRYPLVGEGAKTIVVLRPVDISVLKAAIIERRQTAKRSER